MNEPVSPTEDTTVQQWTPYMRVASQNLEAYLATHRDGTHAVVVDVEGTWLPIVTRKTRCDIMNVANQIQPN